MAAEPFGDAAADDGVGKPGRNRSLSHTGIAQQ
jgi:hypothetical protein